MDGRSVVYVIIDGKPEQLMRVLMPATYYQQVAKQKITSNRPQAKSEMIEMRTNYFPTPPVPINASRFCSA